MTHPEITPDQAAHVLRILGEWTKRGWFYGPSMRLNHGREFFSVDYSNPSSEPDELRSEGCSPFDALCQATTVMQILLEEHPREATWLAEGRARWTEYLASQEPRTP